MLSPFLGQPIQKEQKMHNQHDEILTGHQEVFLNHVRKGWMPPKGINVAKLKDMSNEAKKILISKGVVFPDENNPDYTPPSASIDVRLTQPLIYM
jgi:hypothetical protein